MQSDRLGTRRLIRSRNFLQIAISKIWIAKPSNWFRRKKERKNFFLLKKLRNFKLWIWFRILTQEFNLSTWFMECDSINSRNLFKINWTIRTHSARSQLSQLPHKHSNHIVTFRLTDGRQAGHSATVVRKIADQYNRYYWFNSIQQYENLMWTCTGNYFRKWRSRTNLATVKSF